MKSHNHSSFFKFIQNYSAVFPQANLIDQHSPLCVCSISPFGFKQIDGKQITLKAGVVLSSAWITRFLSVRNILLIEVLNSK